MERANAPIFIACGLVGLGMYLNLVVLPAYEGRALNLSAGLFLSLIMAVPGVIVTVLAHMNWRRAAPFPRPRQSDMSLTRTRW